MKTLQLYLTRQVLLTLVMTVAVFTFVMLLGNVLKEILALLVSRQITLGLVFKAIGLLIPYVMAYVLPFGMLTATLLVFGRFSADQELTAARASGISLVALITPVLFLSVLLSGLCGLFNLWIAPECRHAYKNLVFQLRATDVANLISEDRFISEIPGIILYVRKKDGDRLEDIRLYTLKENKITERIFAKRGLILWDQTGTKISFRFTDAMIQYRIDPNPAFEANYVGPPSPEARIEWLPMPMGQVDTEPPINLTRMLKDERKPKVSEMNLEQLQAERRNLEEKGISSMPVQVQIHRQISFSFACFAFTLIAIPLAIRAHRRETSIGVGIALLLVLFYYSFLILGDALEANEKLQPHLIVWAPNFLFQGLGGFLLWRANGRA